MKVAIMRTTVLWRAHMGMQMVGWRQGVVVCTGFEVGRISGPIQRWILREILRECRVPIFLGHCNISKT